MTDGFWKPSKETVKQFFCCISRASSRSANTIFFWFFGSCRGSNAFVIFELPVCYSLPIADPCTLLPFCTTKKEIFKLEKKQFWKLKKSWSRLVLVIFLSNSGAFWLLQPYRFYFQKENRLIYYTFSNRPKIFVKCRWIRFSFKEIRNKLHWNVGTCLFYTRFNSKATS